MKVVIDIDEKIFQQAILLQSRGNSSVYAQIIANGTPLPKGHGNLIDADALILGLDEYNEYATFDCNAVKDFVDEAPTVIPANKEDSDESSN